MAQVFIAGQHYRIYDGAKSERITIASTYTYGSTTIPLTAPLTHTHAAGVAIGNLPNALKEVLHPHHYRLHQDTRR
jgi:hypothetical protein